MNNNIPPAGLDVPLVLKEGKSGGCCNRMTGSSRQAEDIFVIIHVGEEQLNSKIQWIPPS